MSIAGTCSELTMCLKNSRFVLTMRFDYFLVPIGSAVNQLCIPTCESIDNFDVMFRKAAYGFIKRIDASDNCIVVNC